MRIFNKLIIGFTFLLILTIAILLLLENNFFIQYDSKTFNEIITPIATIFAVVVYLYTLLEIKKQSKISNDNFQFSYFKEKIEKEKIKLKNSHFSSVVMSAFEGCNNIISKTDGLSYYDAYHELYFRVLKSKQYNEDLKAGVNMNYDDSGDYIENLYTLLTFSFEIKLNNSNIENIFQEIRMSNLSNFHKKSLNEIVITELLNDYLLIFNSYLKGMPSPIKIKDKWLESSYNELLYISSRDSLESYVDKELNVHSSLKYAGIDRLIHYIKKNKIWNQ